MDNFLGKFNVLFQEIENLIAPINIKEIGPTIIPNT